MRCHEERDDGDKKIGGVPHRRQSVGHVDVDEQRRDMKREEPGKPHRGGQEKKAIPKMAYPEKRTIFTLSQNGLGWKSTRIMFHPFPPDVSCSVPNHWITNYIAFPGRKQWELGAAGQKMQRLQERPTVYWRIRQVGRTRTQDAGPVVIRHGGWWAKTYGAESTLRTNVPKVAPAKSETEP